MRAELDIKPSLWFFDCHFKGNPVMPGCLGLDALWQMVGFYLAWLDLPGRGMALGVGEVKFTGKVRPTVEEVTYGIDFKRVFKGKLVLGIADGWVAADGERIYEAKDLSVGLAKAEAPAVRLTRTEQGAGQAPRGELDNETSRRHRHGDCVVDRQQRPGSDRFAARSEDRASSRADKYAELGFRSQVHGMPTLDASTIVDRRAMRFHATGTAWNHVAMEQAIADVGP